MNITVSSNAVGVERAFRRLFKDQLPFATSRAINATALSFQKVQLRHQRRIFTVRRQKWMDYSVKIKKPWARKHRLYVDVLIDPPSRRGSTADILTKFETRGRKRAIDAGSVAIPVRGRAWTTKTGLVPKRMRAKSFGLRPWGKGRAGARPRVEVGKQRTVLIRKRGGQSGAIFRRVGRRSSGYLQLLYTLRASVPIQPSLRFHQNARRTVRRVFPTHMRREFRYAVRKAR